MTNTPALKAHEQQQITVVLQNSQDTAIKTAN